MCNTILTHISVGLSPDAGDIVPAEVAQLQTKLKVVSQRVLQALQLSPDLQQRGTVRRCLDDLTSMLPVISQAATDCASGVLCVHVCVCVCVFECVCVGGGGGGMCVCVCVCLCAFGCVCLCLRMARDVCVFVFVCVFVYV